jgi:hypothetical protein
MSEKFQFRSFKKDEDEYQFYNSLDRIMNVTSEDETVFELVRMPKDEDSDAVFDCFALYLHPDNSREWRPCRVLLKFGKPGEEEKFNVEFEH